MQSTHKHKKILYSIAPLVTGLIVLVLVAITAVNYYYRPKTYLADLIVKDIATLHDIFMKIDGRCKILGFDYRINPINFLNVASFSGSEVGSMNLTYPTQWQGPYVPENIRVQNKEYQIIKTKNGLFITPGQGVQLPNGKTIGKDLMLDEHSDIAALMQDKEGFLYEGRVLAAPLVVGYSEFQKALLQGAPEIDVDMLGASIKATSGVRLAQR